MKTKICISCLKEYYKLKWKSQKKFENQKYCSRSCINLWRTKAKKINNYLELNIKKCLECNNQIKFPKYRVSKKNWDKRIYCSLECRNKNHKLNSIPHKKWSENWRYKKELHFCKECGFEKNTPNIKICKKCTTKKLRWVNHPNYKDGSSINQRNYSYEYKKWRMDVFKRDCFSCQECWYKWKDIQAHHIKTVKNSPNLIHDINNWITLCIKCHNKTRCKEYLFEEKYNLILSLKK